MSLRDLLGDTLARAAEVERLLSNPDTFGDSQKVAELGPVRRDQWRSWTDVAAVFDGPSDPDCPPDPDWERDRDRIDQTPTDPWPA